MIGVAASDGTRVAGRSALQVGELAWVFLPDKVWTNGDYKLMIHPRLEDACGNEVGEPFEQPAQPIAPVVKRSIEVPFRID